MALEIRENIPLATYTTLHIGGVADYLVEVKSVEELRAALLFAQEQTKVPPLILGGGSNVLISDEGYRGLVIIINIGGRRYAPTTENQIELTCGAGEILDDVVAETVAKELWGFENLSSIPGTVGATPVQNVGAYGVEISSIVTSVKTLNKKTFTEKIFSKEECKFEYRDSFFKTEEGKNFIVTEVTFLLQKNYSPVVSYGSLAHLEAENISPTVVREEVQKIRSGKFPDWNLVGTAGSFFKNPIIEKEHYMAIKKDYPELVAYELDNEKVKIALGWILDVVCNLRGYCEGNICLYDKQALVLVAEKNATAAEIKNFVTHIEKKVFEKTKIKIEREVLYI